MSELIIQSVQKAVAAITPWLVGTAVGFFLLWLAMLIREKKPFAKELKWFSGLAPLHKFIVVCTVCFFTLWGGSKERGILPSGLIDDISSTVTRVIETVQPRSLPEEVATNALVVTDFAVDTPNQTVVMEVTCASNLFEYTDSRYLDIFMSTNLLVRRWFWIGDFIMPLATNSHIISMTESAGDMESQIAFTNSFGRMAFFTLAADIDSDGDGLTDSYESRTSFTDPLKSDTDGDGIPDGRELRPWVGTDPLLYDTDGDGVGDGDEIAAGSNPLSCDSDGDGLSDADELGSMTACVNNNFLWFDLSGATGLIESSSASYGEWPIALSQAHVINDLCYTNAKVLLDGTVHLLCPTNINAWADECDYGTLSNSQYSSCHVTIALCGASLYAKTDEWGSQILHGTVQSGGKGYTVIEYRNIGLQYYNNTNELITCQLIIPHSETNTIYVSYLCTSNTFRSVEIVAGVQCGWMPSTRDGEDYYNLSWPITTDFPSDSLTIKYSIGTFTDPRAFDTDDDGLSDHEEIVIRKTNPLNHDTDDDGLYDGEEIAIGTNPCNVDTDGDGLMDGTEVVFGSDPLMSDTDGDGVDDFIEYLIDSNPTTAHSDGDAWSDLDELGCVVELPQEEFLWLDLSDGENLLGNNSTLNSRNWPIAMGGDFVVNDLCYTNARVCLDGMVYLLNPTNNTSASYSDSYGYSYGFSNSYFSATHIALAGYNANMYAKSAWGSALLHGMVSTNGHTYKVVEYRNIGHYNYQNTNDVLLTYQLIFPLQETNVFYVSYLQGDALFETFNPLVGMQCPTMRSVVYTNQNYSLSWKMRSGVLDTPLTLKFCIGTGTHPAKTDTDGDGLSDSDELLIHRTNPRNPDCDGDGLPDGAEIKAGTGPFSGDSDGDGMPDGWEVQNGLDPLVDDSCLDNDTDDVSNFYEYWNSTNPSAPDTDGDGLLDVDEATWLSTSENIPWFDMTDATVFPPASSTDVALYPCDLPFTNRIAALPVTTVVADINGVVYFGNASTTNGLYSRNSGWDMADDNSFPSIAVAPYWTDLCLRTAIGSAISYKKVNYSGQNYFVLQFQRVAIYHGTGNEVTFQVSIPETSPSNVVYVRYGSIVDARNSYYKVSVGAQAFSNLAKLPVSYASPAQTPVTNGMVVAYHFGCGSDPAEIDTDGDGVRDDVELLHGSNPRNSNTDGDSMTDEWEIRYGLDPCSADGANGTFGDFDGDFLSNDKEQEYETNPAMPDSDGDGVVDGIETGSVFVTNALPWLVFDECEDITAVIASNYGKCVHRMLPVPLSIQGERVTNVTIYANGALCFNKVGYANPGYSLSGSDFKSIVNRDALVLAPYLQSACIRSDVADRETSIKYGTATHDGIGYILLEYLNSFYSTSSSQTDSISFQIAIPTNAADRAYSRYLDVTGQYMDGRYASIGMQTFDGKWLHSWCYHTSGKVYDGLTLEFLFGVNSDPHSTDTDKDGLPDGQEVTMGLSPAKSDTDGDGLPDGWEVQHSLSPLSINGNDGDAGDPDGDGVDNLNEYNMGTNPNAADSDNDGLLDGEEVVCVSFATPLPWLEFSSTITNLTSEIADSYGCITIGLPSPITIQQEIVTNITIDVDGVVFFNKAGYVNPEWTSRTYNFDDGVADANCFTVAPYWDWFFLSDDAAPSSVKLGTATVGTNGYYLLECKHLYSDLNSYETNAISFQVAFPTGHVDRIHVRYADVVGDEMDGRYALIGCQSFDAKENVTYCNSEQGMVSDGMGLCFVVGYGSDPTKVDTDGDGVADKVEIEVHGSDPRFEDADGDGLSDSAEIALGTSILNPDSDGDGLLDGWEVANSFNPLSQPGQGEADDDADGDGLTNLDEQLHGSNPRNSDTDNDGLSDPAEIARGTDISLGDTDHDGLLDGVEVSFGTDPLQPDTDSDGMNDGWEYQYRAAGFDPRVDNARDRNPDNDIDADPDGDGLTNGEECEWGSNPSGMDVDGNGVPDGYDTDGDGVSDGAEVRQNSDPTDASDEGKPNTRIPISFHFGDPSGSHSEKYRLEVTPVSGHGEAPASFSWLNENYGESETKRAMLKPGWKYEVRLYHAGTDPDYDGSPRPDYDYELSCDRSTAIESVIVVDDDGLFDGCDDGEVFTAAGKVAVIYAIGTPRLVFDYDRDGYISDADIAKAKAGKATFRFWMNDDGDSGDVCSNADFNSDRPSHGYNYQDDKVNGRRDLLDFTPVWIDFSEVYPPNTPDEIKNKITWKLRSSCVNVVWTSFSRSDAGDFLWYDKQGCGKGLGQYAHEAETVAIDGGKEFPYSFKEAMKNSPDKGVFLIEGRGGRDGLEIVGTGRFDNEIIRGEANLSISSVERMYRWFCHRTYAGGARGLNNQAGSPWNWPDNECDGRHFVFVHGFNVNADEARALGSEMFKRLWQSGSKSMFTVVDWFGNEDQYDSLIFDGTVSPNYYANVLHAFQTAPSLASRCASLPGTKVLIAHSLGNILVSSAIKDCGLTGYSRYYMLNAAVAMEAYDSTAFTTAMDDSEWQNVPPQYWASNWSGLFSEDDFRHSLSWRGRFAGVANAVNCFSESDEILANAVSGQVMFAGSVWRKQEVTKGTTIWNDLNVGTLGTFDIACEGGWGINTYYSLNPLWYVYQYGFTERASTLTRDQAIVHPPFTPFRSETANMHSTNLFTIANADDRKMLRAKFLGDAIPARSFATGANETSGLSQNLSLATCRGNESKWPEERENGNDKFWRHSDFKNLAYPFTRKLFDKIVNNEPN